MMGRAKALWVRGTDAFLNWRGYTGQDLDLARRSVRDWARARLRRPFMRGSVAGFAVVIPRVGRAELVSMEVPLPGLAEITVEMHISAISPGTERAQWLRRPNAQPNLPFYPGYSGAGRVLAVGRGVTGIAEGDLVAIPRIAHASVATVPAKWALHVPEGVPVAQAALVYLAMISGYGLRRAHIAGGESVCVIGAGPIGALAARLARAAGAGSITIVARTRRHERSAALLGADFRLVEQGLNDIAADVVIEATGDADAIGAAIAAARDKGTVVLLGSSRGVSQAVPLAELQRRSLRLVGAHISALAVEARRSGADPFAELGTIFLDGLRTGAIRADDLAGEAVDPREIGLMYRRLAEGSLGSAYLDWSRIPREERAQRRGFLAAPRLPPMTCSVQPQTRPAASATPRPLRFAVVGCGDIGLSNARAVSRAKNAELVIVHDSIPQLAEAVARRHGGTVVPTLEQALDKKLVDAVFLSVPHDLHASMIADAAAKGLHILVEKPLAVDLSSAAAAVEAARAAGVILSVCFPYRYEAAPAAGIELVRGGALGSLRGASVAFHADKPQSYWHGGFSGRASSDWRMSAERSGGGVMIMNMTHFVDLLRHMSGSEIAEVHAVANVPAGQEVEDQIGVTVRFQGGAVGTLVGSASSRGTPGSRLEIWGEHGTVELGPKPRIYTERAVPGLVTGRWNELPEEENDVRTIFVERFAAAVLEEREPDVTAMDGLAVQAFVDAVYRSVASGQPEAVAPVSTSA
jgi:predicted dehydrogenase/NADPH:quinone reductase-like Zn-dependent oxidoreductase